jgi:hypothetical protein
VKKAAQRNNPRARQRQSLRALQKIAPVVRLQELIVCNSATVSGSNPVVVITPEEAWSYAIMLPLRLAEFSKVLMALVRVEIQIEYGRVGVGCIAADLRTYVGDGEQILTVGDSQCDIPVAVDHAARWLVIRNAQYSGSSKISLKRINTFQSEPISRTSHGVNI